MNEPQPPSEATVSRAGCVGAIEWIDGKAVMIDQRRLPFEEVYVTCETWTQVADAIRDMVIRGAPAIGVAAAFGVVLAARKSVEEEWDVFVARLQDATKGLFATRPTAVNLRWALDEMRRVWGFETPRDPRAVAGELEDTAIRILEEDIESCVRIGEYGAGLIMAGPAVSIGGAESPVILTHCNAGALATAGYGTALGVVRSVFARDAELRVFVDETRPFLQGARLTAWELSREGIPFSLICDNMAGHFLSRGEITHVVVGADRIAANGDAANKIGTYPLSVLAREHDVPFYVAAPLSTVDLSMSDGSGIPIEERSSDEVMFVGATRMAPRGACARNPAFDVTPAGNITAIITDAGVALPPFEKSLAGLMAAGSGGHGKRIPAP